MLNNQSQLRSFIRWISRNIRDKENKNVLTAIKNENTINRNIDKFQGNKGDVDSVD